MRKKKSSNKIIKGLTKAIAHARGEKTSSKISVYPVRKRKSHIEYKIEPYNYKLTNPMPSLITSSFNTGKKSIKNPLLKITPSKGRISNDGDIYPTIRLKKAELAKEKAIARDKIKEHLLKIKLQSNNALWKLVDPINKPSHYTSFGEGYEVIEVLEKWLTKEEFIGAMKFNIIKYQARARLKNGNEDYFKAEWYSKRLAEYLRKHEN